MKTKSSTSKKKAKFEDQVAKTADSPAEAPLPTPKKVEKEEVVTNEVITENVQKSQPETEVPTPVSTAELPRDLDKKKQDTVEEENIVVEKPSSLEKIEEKVVLPPPTPQVEQIAPKEIEIRKEVATEEIIPKAESPIEEDLEKVPLEEPKELSPLRDTEEMAETIEVSESNQQQIQLAKAKAEDEAFSQTSTNPGSIFSDIEEIKIEPKQKVKRKKAAKKKPKRKKARLAVAEEVGGAPRKAEKTKPINFSDRMVRVALKYTRAPTRYIVKKLPSLREDLLRSNLRISPEGLIAISLMFSLIALPFTIFGSYELWNMGLHLEAPFLPAAVIVPFILGITIPKISAGSRGQALDNELPYLFAYITVLAGGGISPITTLKRITKAAKIFPASAKEASRILMDIEIFGLDAISALEREARITPNKVFSDFVGGYVAVLKTGGDALSFLEAKLKEIFSYRESKLKIGSEFIATMSEAYIITTVVMGVSLMVLWATQNLMSPNGLASSNTNVNTSLILMFSGLFVPVISVIFIVVIGSSQIREPYSFDLPFYIFLGCIPVGAIIYFLPLHLISYMQLGIGLLTMSTPPMFIQMRYKRQKESVEAKLPNFLRDISEVRKTGLAPEKTIEQIANRNYGGLSVHVKKIAAQLSWGTPMKTVLQTFINEVKSWVSRAVAFLLLEVVDVGGGSAKMFISLADFTEKNAQLDKERKSMIRPYIIIPYIGAILIVATTAMMVYFVSTPGIQNTPGLSGFLPSPVLIAKAINVLLTASFFQAWVMGFVGGKMGEGSAADGFKHATFLIIISMITVVVAGSMIGGISVT